MTRFLLVETPTSCRPERDYVLGIALRDRLGLSYRVSYCESRSDTAFTCPGTPGKVVVPDAYLAIDQAGGIGISASPPFPELATLAGSVPALFGGLVGPAILQHEGTVSLRFDLLGSLFYLLTGMETRLSHERDSHGRLTAANSPLAVTGTLDQPLGETYIALLREALQLAWPQLEVQLPIPSLTLTHDIDQAFSCRRPIMRRLGAAVRDVIRHLDLDLAARTALPGAACNATDHRYDPYNTFRYLMQQSETRGLSSTFFALATQEGEHGADYALADPFIRSLFREIERRGHAIGLHVGYEAQCDPTRLQLEVAKLRSALADAGLSADRMGGRGHYLRWQGDETWADLADAGIAYDSTVAFADRAVFRSGMAGPYQTFNVTSRRVLPLIERPLTLMDVTVRHYMGLNLEETSSLAKALADSTFSHGGEFVLLWHNSGLQTRHERDIYDSVLDTVTSSLERARRSVTGPGICLGPPEPVTARRHARDARPPIKEVNPIGPRRARRASPPRFPSSSGHERT